MTSLESSQVPSLGTQEHRHHLVWGLREGVQLEEPLTTCSKVVRVHSASNKHLLFLRSLDILHIRNNISLGVTILTHPIKSTKLDLSLWLVWNKIRLEWKDLLLNSKSFSPLSLSHSWCPGFAARNFKTGEPTLPLLLPFLLSPPALPVGRFQWAPAVTRADSIPLPGNSLKRSTCCCGADRACPSAPVMLWPNFYLSCAGYKRKHLQSWGLGSTELSALFFVVCFSPLSWSGASPSIWGPPEVMHV